VGAVAPLRAAAAAAALLALAGCSALTGGSPGPSLPRYTCEHGITFSVRFVDDTVVLDGGAQGRDLLYRDAGGLTPQQTVYSNGRMRAEFGLGASGREAILRYPLLPLVARCVRD